MGASKVVAGAGRAENGGVQEEPGKETFQLHHVHDELSKVRASPKYAVIFNFILSALLRQRTLYDHLVASGKGTKKLQEDRGHELAGHKHAAQIHALRRHVGCMGAALSHGCAQRRSAVLPAFMTPSRTLFVA